MRKSILVLFIGALLLNCSVKNPKEFSEKALNDVFISLDGKNVIFKDILENNKGKKIIIDVWASWCTDCLQSLPKVKELQEKDNKVVYVFLSLDKDIESWKYGVERLKIKGQHYYMKSGWKGDFGEFLGLSWIPRYLLINETGEIELFNETKVSNSLINKTLKK